MAEKDTLAEGKDAFELCSEVEQENRARALEDLRFARLGEQWPQEAIKARGKDRPMLTINRMPAFIRQVVNDARQNKPQIKVKPVDGKADLDTAEVINGLIRNIEYTSNADVAYDTAADFAVTMGWGYIRVSVDYACDDTFDKDLRIERVANPFSIFGDPHSTAADSSDWNVSFVVDRLSKDTFAAKYKGAEPVNWDEDGYSALSAPWLEDEEVLVAEWWKREEIEKTLLRLSNGLVLYQEQYEKGKDLFDALGVTVAQERPTRGYKVTQRIMTGAEVLEENEWAGRYIPIIPVYGEEVNVEGKRYFRSLIRDAKDAQRMFNYWRTTTTELVALAPKAPWVGPVGSFETDRNWDTANTENHPYLEYDIVQGGLAPQRQPFSGVPAGALQEALNASDDMKSIMGLYDASLGARSNETSGRAIMTRQREGDVSTFHFIDNLTRAIRHTGRVLIDLIPLVYNTQRIVRVLGNDGKPQNVAIGPVDQNAPAPPPAGFDRIYDLAAGKYDLAVDAGPSFTTRREEVLALMTEMMRAWPQAVPVLGDLVVKYMDLPDAEEIQKRLRALSGAGVDPQQVQKLQQEIQKLQQENAQLRIKAGIEAEKVAVDRFEAETERLKVANEIVNPKPVMVRPQSQPF